jgi:hypothetical protein
MMPLRFARKLCTVERNLFKACLVRFRLQVPANDAALLSPAVGNTANGTEGISPSQISLAMVNPRNLSTDISAGLWPVRVWIDWFNSSSDAQMHRSYNVAEASAVLQGPDMNGSLSLDAPVYVVPGSHDVHVAYMTANGLWAKRVHTVEVRAKPCLVRQLPMSGRRRCPRPRPSCYV